MQIAEAFSPRYERLGDDGVLIDLAGLRPLFGDAYALGQALRQHATALGLVVHVAIAGTQTAARLLAVAHEGLTVIDAGQERQALAPLPISALDALLTSVDHHESPSRTFTSWGLRTLGDVAALPTANLRARTGSRGIAWQTAARGEDVRPLLPTRPDERFEGALDLEWPIEGLEPLSFVLTRLLEPLSVRLERRDRGVAAIHLALRLVTKDTLWRHLELPAPMRDVRTLRTLLLLRVEAHPPAAAIDRVAIVLDPTPARIVQHTLFSRAQPAPEQVSTLVARLAATMGSDRVGTPVAVDTDRPGAFAMRAFRTIWDANPAQASVTRPSVPTDPISAFRQYRPPVPARVAVDAAGVPVRITVDRAGLEGGPVRTCAGPWRTSGAWWSADTWDREEWDVCLASGIVYRLAGHGDTRRWFIHAIAD